jgi:thiol-disulfide isomerase/thioredoxin
MFQIVYIGASWCKTCKVIKPATEELARRFNVPLVIKDYDDDLTEDEKAVIKKVPTLRVLDEKGAQIAQWDVNQVASLTAWLESNVSLGAYEDF